MREETRIPEWLRESHPPAAGTLRRGSGERFLDRTVSHAAAFARDVLYNERISAKDGLLQRISPGLKIPAFMLLIVALSLQRSAWAALFFPALAIALAAASAVPLRLLLARLIPVAGLAALVAIPALFNVFVDGEPLLVLARLGSDHAFGPFRLPADVAMTRQGLSSACMLIARVAGSACLVFLMTMTTRPAALIAAVTRPMPAAFAAMISICYRYVFFLVRRIEETGLGMKSRTIGRVGAAGGRRWVASRIGLMFRISMRLAADLEMAMAARGADAAGMPGRFAGRCLDRF